jgi:hypothetical protein
MFKYISRRKTQQTINAAIAGWMDDLDSLIALLDHDIIELRKDLEDLTDFVESELD